MMMILRKVKMVMVAMAVAMNFFHTKVYHRFHAYTINSMVIMLACNIIGAIVLVSSTPIKTTPSISINKVHVQPDPSLSPQYSPLSFKENKLVPVITIILYTCVKCIHA